MQRKQHGLLQELTFLHYPKRQRDVGRARSRYSFHSQNFLKLDGLVAPKEKIQEEEKLCGISWRVIRCEPSANKMGTNF